MKELSIEGKATRYDQAIKVAKSKIKNDKDHVLYEDDVIEIFPELTESEDERIRKSLSTYFAKFKPNGMWDADFSNGDIVAWLEKQGEHANFRNNIQIGDKVTRNEDGVLVNLSQLNRVAKKDEKQGEQKPADFSDLRTWKYIVDAVRSEIEGIGQYLDSPFTEKVAKKLQKRFGNIEQQKQEWSEEDERNMNWVINVWNRLRRGGDAQTTPNQMEFLENWLNSLKDRVQPKQEWSDEDERILVEILKIFNVENFEEYNIGENNEDALKFLKSIKDRVQSQNTWKPSDEQMKSLRWVIEYGNTTQTETLRDIYEQLKKLKE